MKRETHNGIVKSAWSQSHDEFLNEIKHAKKKAIGTYDGFYVSILEC